MCVSHVIVDQKENGLNGLLDQYHRYEMMQEDELIEVFEA